MKFSLVLLGLGITDCPKSFGQLYVMAGEGIANWINSLNIDWNAISSWFWSGLTWLFTAQWLW